MLHFMLDLPKEYPWLYYRFAELGYHTVRRSDRFWEGLWTDLIFDQVIMWSIKSRGGLTRSRGFSESVRLMWVHSVHEYGEIHNVMTILTGLEHTTSEQHIELRKSQVKRVNIDLLKIQYWFEKFEPFDSNEPSLRSILSGVVTSIESGVNCHNIEKIGETIQKSLYNMALQYAKLAKILEGLKIGITIGKETVHIDPMVLFARLMLILQREVDLSPYFAYELTSVPTALFEDNVMRKANKALLTKSLISNTQPKNANTVTTEYVLDGGSLLHIIR
ncbi:uncharacterized protein LOC144357000 [Saccoglossus kowalevskii]